MRNLVHTAVCLVLNALFDASVFSLPVSADDKAEPQILFTNVHVFDGMSDKLATNRRVLVDGNLIKAIGDETLKAAEGSTVIDGGGRTVMPGLIDAQVHLNMQFLGYCNDRGIQGAQFLPGKRSVRSPMRPRENTCLRV